MFTISSKFTEVECILFSYNKQIEKNEINIGHKSKRNVERLNCSVKISFSHKLIDILDSQYSVQHYDNILDLKQHQTLVCCFCIIIYSQDKYCYSYNVIKNKNTLV